MPCQLYAAIKNTDSPSVNSARPIAETPRPLDSCLVQTPRIACEQASLGVTVAPGHGSSARGSFWVMSCRAVRSCGAREALELFAQLVVAAMNSKFDGSFGRAKDGSGFLNA